VNIFSVI